MQRIENVNEISHFWHANAEKIHLLTSQHLNQQRLNFLFAYHDNINQINMDELVHSDLLTIKNYTTTLKLYVDFLTKYTSHFIHNGLQMGYLVSFREEMNALYTSCIGIREKIDELLEGRFKNISNQTSIHHHIDDDHLKLKQFFLNDCHFIFENKLLITPFKLLTKNIEKEDNEFLNSLLAKQNQDQDLNHAELSDHIKNILGVYLSLETIIQLSMILILNDGKKTPFIHRPLIKKIQALGFHETALKNTPSTNTMLNESLTLLCKNKPIVEMNQSAANTNGTTRQRATSYFTHNTSTHFNPDKAETAKPRKRAMSQPSLKIPTPISSTSKRLFSLISPREHKAKTDSNPSPAIHKK